MNITWFVYIESTSICQYVNLQPSIAKLESSQCRGKVPQSSGVPAMAPSPCIQKIIKEMQWVQWCPWFPQPVRIWCMNESTMPYFSRLGCSFCSLMWVNDCNRSFSTLHAPSSRRSHRKPLALEPTGNSDVENPRPGLVFGNKRMISQNLMKLTSDEHFPRHL